MHDPWDENYFRGYEWWLMTEAKKVLVFFNYFMSLFVRDSKLCRRFDILCQKVFVLTVNSRAP